MIDLYNYDVYYNSEKINNILNIDTEYYRTLEARYIKIEHLDNNGKLKEIVGKTNQFCFKIKVGE